MAEASEGADFAGFYAANFQRLAAQLSLYAGDIAEAQDAVQEAMVRALARWDTISSYDDPAAWVRKVAWNLATSRWRRLRRVISLSDWHARPGPEPHHPPSGLDNVALAGALAALPQRHRQAIILFYLLDLPVTEIASIAGVAEGTVKSWLHRGRAAMAGHFVESAVGEVDRV